jgi:hypothetical protein
VNLNKIYIYIKKLEKKKEKEKEKERERKKKDRGGPRGHPQRDGCPTGKHSYPFFFFIFSF